MRQKNTAIKIQNESQFYDKKIMIAKYFIHLMAIYNNKKNIMKSMYINNKIIILNFDDYNLPILKYNKISSSK